MRTTPPTDAARLRRRLGNVAVILLAGVGVVAVGLVWLDHATPARTTTYAPSEPAVGAPAPAVVPTADRPVAGRTPPPARATTATAEATGRFAADVTSSAPERTVAVWSVDPCPAPPTAYDARDVAVTVTLRRPADTDDASDYAGEQVTVAADGSWRGNLAIGRPPAGAYDLDAVCEARLAGSYQRYADRYAPVPFAVEPT